MWESDWQRKWIKNKQSLRVGSAKTLYLTDQLWLASESMTNVPFFSKQGNPMSFVSVFWGKAFSWFSLCGEMHVLQNGRFVERKKNWYWELKI